MADENPPPPPKPAASVPPKPAADPETKSAADPAPTLDPVNPPPAGAPPTAAPDHARADHPAGTVPATAPPVPTPPVSASGEAAAAPRSNAASGVTDPAPPRAPGVAPAEPKVPAGAPPAVPRPEPATAASPAERAPAAVNTKGPADATTPGGPNPGAETAAAGERAAAAVAGSPVAPRPPAPPTVVKPAAPAAAAAPVVAKPAVAPAAPATARPADEGVSRRSFMSLALPVGWVAFSAACASSLVATARFMFPNVLFEPPQSFKAGFPGEYNVGEVDTRFKDAFGVWIVREADGFYALIAVCTHLGCSPNWLPAENKFKCPCHGSGFYRTGVNFEGPAPRPLERARIVLSDDGQLLVDKAVKFQEEKGEWTKPEAFLKA
jgi:cytochrome b6-f complex iron-sulfur subunit